MAERTYLVGLPVVVTVSDEGRVTWSIDTSETDITSDLEVEDEDQVLADDRAVRKVLTAMSSFDDPFRHFTHPVEFSSSFGGGWWLSKKMEGQS